MSLVRPNIPRLPASVPREVQRAFDAISNYFVQADKAGGLATINTVAAEVETLALDVSAPSAMSGLTVTGAFNKIFLEWDAYLPDVQVEIHRSETDDLGTAVQIGQCQSAQRVFVDPVPDSSLGKTYYYWIRGNRNGTAGPWNQTAGTSGHTADDPEYILEVASEKWQAGYNYAIGDLSMPTIPNGYCYEVTADSGSSGLSEPLWPTTINATVSDGGLTWKCKSAFSFEQFFKLALVGGVPKLTLRELFLADGIIKNAMIANLAVDNAKIADLSVAKLLAGIIQASGIYLGATSRIHLDGVNEQITISDGTRARITMGKIGSDWTLQIVDASGNIVVSADGGVPSTAVTGLGTLSTLNGFTVSNISSYFETLAITEALIANAAVGTLKIQDNAVTVPVVAVNDASITLTTSYQDILSANIDSEGQPIYVFFNAFHENTVSTTVQNDVYLKVLSEGSEIKTAQVSHAAISDLQHGVATIIAEVPTPSTGTITITVQAKKTTDNGAFATLEYRTLYLQGVKR